MECGDTVGPPRGSPLKAAAEEDNLSDCDLNDSQPVESQLVEAEIDSPCSGALSTPTDCEEYQIDHVALEPSQREALHREMAHEFLHADVPCWLCDPFACCSLCLFP